MSLEEGQSVTDGSDIEATLIPAVPGGIRRAGLAKALLAGVASAVVVGVVAWPRRQLQKVVADEKVDLFGPASLMLAGESLMSAIKAAGTTHDSIAGASKAWNDATAPMSSWKQTIAESGEPHEVDLQKMSNLTEKELLAQESNRMHDGNICNNDEEMHANLCYKKCSKLTDGKYPVRTTAWSCCEEQPCSFFNSKFTNPLNLCEGFDVAGSVEGKGCPHVPGDCMVDEEFNLGLCYKKCAILTSNKFPFRSGSDTCCRYSSHFACLDAMNTNSSLEFNVGGGYHDHDPLTPNMTHTPMVKPTESVPDQKTQEFQAEDVLLLNRGPSALVMPPPFSPFSPKLVA